MSLALGPGATDSDLMRRYHEHGDTGARAELVERNLPLVARLAQRYANRGEALEDLTQAGSVGLIKAIDRYDPSRQTSLAAYAAPNILGEIRRHFRDRTWALHVPREVQELIVRLAGLVDALPGTLGRPPSVEELAPASRTDVESVVEALESSRAHTPLPLADSKTDDDDESQAAADPGAYDIGFKRVEDRAALREVLRGLPRRDRTILLMRFLEGLTQTEIADRVGISQMHVSRVIRRSLDQAQQRLEQIARRPGAVGLG